MLTLGLDFFIFNNVFSKNHFADLLENILCIDILIIRHYTLLYDKVMDWVKALSGQVDWNTVRCKYETMTRLSMKSAEFATW